MRSLAQLLLTFLLNASWQIAVVTVFASCCSWLLRETAAWCRHSVWVAALVISLCLPIITGLNALELSPIPKPKVTRIEPEKRVTSPVSLREIDLTEPTIVPVQMAKVDPARQGGWIGASHDDLPGRRSKNARNEGKTCATTAVSSSK